MTKRTRHYINGTLTCWPAAMPFLKTVTSSAAAPSALSICRNAFVAPLLSGKPLAFFIDRYQRQVGCLSFRGNGDVDARVAAFLDRLGGAAIGIAGADERFHRVAAGREHQRSVVADAGRADLVPDLRHLDRD